MDRFAWPRTGVASPVDAAVAVACLWATLARVPFDWLVCTLAAMSALPLLWRRERPVVVLVVVGAGTVGLCATGAMGTIPLAYGYLVAFYTVMSLAPPLWRWLAVGATATGVLVVVLVVFGQHPDALTTSAFPYVVAGALGFGVRARQERIAVLAERTRRLAEEHAGATARERAGIARDVHDIVAHSLGVMVVQAEAGLVVAGDPARASAALDAISATGRETMTRMSDTLAVLRGGRPADQRPVGLGGLAALVDNARRVGLDATLSENERPPSVPAELGATVYRVVQEAVTNTIRHAGAQRVLVRLEWRETALRVEITDDGRGSSGRAPGRGHGLAGMRERVEALGGLLVTSDLQSGFRVTATLPTSRDRADV